MNLGEEVIVEEGQDWALVPIVEHHSTDLELKTATDRGCPPLRYIAAPKVESSRDKSQREKCPRPMRRERVAICRPSYRGLRWELISANIPRLRLF